MFPIQTAYLKILGVILIIGFLGFHIWSDQRVKAELESTRIQLATKERDLKISQENLIQATTDKKALEDAQLAAQAAQQKLEDELKQTNEKLRKQRAQMPTKCEDVMKWAVEHRGDLKWEK